MKPKLGLWRNWERTTLAMLSRGFESPQLHQIWIVYLGVAECKLDSIHTVNVALAGSSPVCHP